MKSVGKLLFSCCNTLSVTGLFNIRVYDGMMQYLSPGCTP